MTSGAFVAVSFYFFVSVLMAMMIEDEFKELTNHGDRGVFERKDGEYGVRRVIIGFGFIFTSVPIFAYLLIEGVVPKTIEWLFTKR